MKILVIYDIESDKLRNRIIEVCKDYGLHRIQFSCFLGDLDPPMDDELAVKLKATLKKFPGKVHIFPLTKDSYVNRKEYVNLNTSK